MNPAAAKRPASCLEPRAGRWWARITWAQSVECAATAGCPVRGRGAYVVKGYLFEKRLDAYAALWQELGGLPAKKDRDPDPAKDDCVRIAHGLTAWYYTAGGGMFMTDPTRELWRALRDNLLAGGAGPVTLSRQASLLRTQLKADLEVYYGRHVSGDRLGSVAEMEFLKSTVLKPAPFDELPSRIRGWMWLRYYVLRRDEPVMRTRTMWQRVIARGIESNADAMT